MKEFGPLTHERLLEVLDYDADTGLFTWKISTSRRVRVGAIAGALSKVLGYRLIRIDRVLYLAHRLAYFHRIGCWPPDEIDHINGIRDDNRFVNLREANRSENSCNVKKKITNTSGFKGVSQFRGRWAAELWVRWKKIRLGYFDTPEEAYAAYVQSR